MNDFNKEEQLNDVENEVSNVTNQENPELRRLSSRGLSNAILALVMTAWTFWVVFRDEPWELLWVMIFVGADFIGGFTGIFMGYRGRKHNKNIFIATLVLSIISIIGSAVALIIWLT